MTPPPQKNHHKLSLLHQTPANQMSVFSYVLFPAESIATDEQRRIDVLVKCLEVRRSWSCSIFIQKYILYIIHMNIFPCSGLLKLKHSRPVMVRLLAVRHTGISERLRLRPDIIFIVRV